MFKVCSKCGFMYDESIKTCPKCSPQAVKSLEGNNNENVVNSSQPSNKQIPPKSKMPYDSSPNTKTDVKPTANSVPKKYESDNVSINIDIDDNEKNMSDEIRNNRKINLIIIFSVLGFVALFFGIASIINLLQ